MRTLGRLLLGCCIAIAAAGAAGQTGAPLLIIDGAPAYGLVIARVDLTWALKDAPGSPGTLQCPETLQFVPDADYDAHAHATGTIILQLKHGGDWSLPLFPGESAQRDLSLEADTATTEDFAIRFDPKRMAGLPSSIVFPKTGKTFDGFSWNDRVHDRELGSFHLRYDAEAKPEVVSAGPLCTVVRVRARYCKPDGARPASQPEAVYDWYVFHDRPLVFVSASIRQKDPFAWHELHFLELNFPDGSFPAWAGGEPLSEGNFTGTKESFNSPGWGALVDGRNAIGMFGGEVKFYDGRGGYGTYMHSTWQAWSDTECRLGTWLWIGSEDGPAKAVQTAAEQYAQRPRVVVTRQGLREEIENLRKSAQERPEGQRQDALWRAALAERKEAQGRLDEAQQIAEGRLPVRWVKSAAGELGLMLEQRANGATLQSVFDLKAGRELLAPDTPPLFTITLRHVNGKEKAHLPADAGWQQVKVAESPDGFAISWQKPSDERVQGVAVTAKAVPDAEDHAWRWSLEVDNASPDWSVWHVRFPQIALAEPGDNATVLFPRGPGEVKHDVWNTTYTFRGRYPSGWCSMQLMAAYSEGATGLYFGLHDPFASTTDIALRSDPNTRSVHLAYEHPAPDMGVAGNDFALSGEAVWQLLRGNWFDAAMIYKAWARKEARWWPELGPEGREDTPLWMRELCAWAQTGGAPGECVAAVKGFAELLGVPVGFHWYNWHEIPFDNDYPHYFPTKEGFPEAVRELQEANVYVMPYINGRLWDMRDKGMDDFEFTSVALPAVTKNEEGKPHTEMYASNETDGSRVVLGVMCPSTKLWQDKVKDIVLRLEKGVGVKGVYIDQIAAASPKLCMDKTHGHPLGGGHWWTEGYWQMLDAIRSAQPEDAMLTTECNAEPFVRWMDGYLTWHWQHDGQVPVFPAIYGGTVQMFGRAYRGGSTANLALRMKAGQQLVFGEQLGWLNPGLLEDDENARFFRQAVQLRWRLRRYFYAGEMARPPKLLGDIPAVKGDWQWAGEWWVTTDAVLAGAWQLPKDNKLVLIFANVSEAPVTATLEFDAQAYGFEPAPLRLSVIIAEEDIAETTEAPNHFKRELTFPPRAVLAWEFSQ